MSQDSPLIPAQFEPICAYEGEALVQALHRVAADESFQKVLIPLCLLLHNEAFTPATLTQALRNVRTVRDLDQHISLPFLHFVEQETTTCLRLQGLENYTHQPALFLTNHRDIILDSAFLGMLLERETGERVYIGIGNNLYALPWIEDFVRANKAFTVFRGGTPRELLSHSTLLSQYIQYSLHELQHSVWLAQREGRAKDSDDRTQPAVLKMLTMAGEGSFLQRIAQLNICPVALNYEYDPCDYLKAQEMQLKRDCPNHHKTPQNDVLNMKTGLMGYKGQVVFTLTPSINSELAQIGAETSVRNEQVTAVANVIDRHIHQHYYIFNNQRIAYDMLLHTNRFEGVYSAAEKAKFEHYIAQQIERIEVENKDVAFLQERLLQMYANPLINQLNAL